MNNEETTPNPFKENSFEIFGILSFSGKEEMKKTISITFCEKGSSIGQKVRSVKRRVSKTVKNYGFTPLRLGLVKEPALRSGKCYSFPWEKNKRVRFDSESKNLYIGQQICSAVLADGFSSPQCPVDGL